jgi:hypothetical protein
MNYNDFTKKHLATFISKRDNVQIPELKKIRNQIKINKIDFSISPISIPKNTINKLMDTFWVYEEAITKLNEIPLEKQITWTHNNLNHSIIIKTTKDKFDSFKNRLNVLINILNYLLDKSKKKKAFNIYLILTTLKKQLPTNNQIIGPKHINSGYTDFGNNIILIWRDEEFEKVIFHEAIHFLDMDVRNMAFNDNSLPHNIEGPKSYFEAFTDFWGIFYHLIYFSLLTNKSVDSLFQIEYAFIKNQAIMFNNYFDLGKWNNKKTIKQKSPAFSYFILKYLVFKNVIDNGISILDNPKELVNHIFNDEFNDKHFIDTNSSRMTLLQFY